MSYNVLVIPEDFTKDEHILKPLAERILHDSGKPNANVRVCRDPNFGGIGEALKIERLRKDIIARYPMVDLFILCFGPGWRGGARDGCGPDRGNAPGRNGRIGPAICGRPGLAGGGGFHFGGTRPASRLELAGNPRRPGCQEYVFSTVGRRKKHLLAFLTTAGKN